MTALRELAEAAGVSPRWKDFAGQWHEVGHDTLRFVLEALGLPARDQDLAASMAAATSRASLMPLTTARAGERTPLPVTDGPVEAILEDGTVWYGVVEDGMLSPLHQTGYHRLMAGGAETVLAVAPPSCFSVRDAVPDRRPWALAVQLYSLRRPHDGGIGDFGALCDLAGPAAALGASGMAISPVHAQFSADPDRFSPYSPSSRLALNVLHTTLDVPDPALEAGEFVNWPTASRRRLAMLRTRFERATPAELQALDAFRVLHGDSLETHARFEALHAHFFGADDSKWHWRTWPEPFRRPESSTVQAFVTAHAQEVALHAYMQMLADQSLAAAHRTARDAGMPMGLIADLAVGADSGGSQCWGRQSETLLGLTVGAPPDLLSYQGQNWGLAAFSPRGLAQNGFGAFIEMLRTAMRHAGGVRIDHAMGLARLWVVPDGASSRDGAYIHFPLEDMLRLVALESHRMRAVVLGEDLGTVPEGFAEKLVDANILGMRVLWFVRDHAQNFIPPQYWSHNAAAMTGTHDLATVAGWWAGRDLEWRHRLDLFGNSENDHRENTARHVDRSALWQAFCDRGVASGTPPSPSMPDAVLDAAARYVASSPCSLVIMPLEDALGVLDQPNLPGTMDQQHPNWQRRHQGVAAALLDDPVVAARLKSLNGPMV